ncbi:MAG: hypothetical protein J6Y20_10170 [Lachnospiraceae bacterium]|nr:hypothetical protein [Lachnospiraceae bacterium]MBP5462479.1 hypothetical protein [Lachnospiraceae bacterium]
MDYEETMVENEDFDTEADDTLPEGIEEEDMSDEEDLESITEDVEEEEAEEQPQPEQKATEPGWMQQRIGKAVQKALAKERESIRAEMEAQYAPIKERLLEMDAQDLVRKGIVKDFETAKELVRYRQGQATPAPQAPQERVEQPRNENGQFAPKKDPATEARIDMLAHQADTIKEKTGVDVIEAFQNNEDIKQAVIDGDMDFYDVAEQMKAKRRPPSPMRSPNGASGTNPNAINSMSEEQFRRMEKRISEGARIRLK